MIVIIICIDNISSILFEQEAHNLWGGHSMGIHHCQVEGVAALVFSFGDGVGVILKKNLEDFTGGSIGTGVVHWQL